MSARHASRESASRSIRPALASLGVALLAGCTTLGGHVSGDFACRAPEGNCAPASVIDAQALGTLSGDADRPNAETGHRGSVRAKPGDLARTSERKLRIVFPAHVDAAGIYHEESVAWVIAEPADWAARARAPEAVAGLRGIGKAVAERLKPSASAAPHPDEPLSPDVDASAHDDLLLPLASPPTLPFTAREAIAGAHAPAIEGFDTSRNRDRTPRSELDPLITWPSVEAIDAAHARGPETHEATATTDGTPKGLNTSSANLVPPPPDSAVTGMQSTMSNAKSAGAARKPKP